MDRQTALLRARALLMKRTGPFGLMPLERAMTADLDLFVAMRNAGASWRTIAALMAEAGAVRLDGAPLPSAQWSAMISRALKARDLRSPAALASPDPGGRPDSRPRGRSAVARVSVLNAAAIMRRPSAAPDGHADAAPDGERKMPQTERNKEGVREIGDPSVRSTSPGGAADIRARMRRARQLRQQ